jgi:hypothetical protein
MHNKTADQFAPPQGRGNALLHIQRYVSAHHHQSGNRMIVRFRTGAQIGPVGV